MENTEGFSFWGRGQSSLPRGSPLEIMLKDLALFAGAIFKLFTK